MYPNALVRVSNVRIRKWEPPKEKSSPVEPKQEGDAPKETTEALQDIREPFSS